MPEQSEITLTPEQQIACDDIAAWMASGSRTPHTLAGYAGTGKSTVIASMGIEGIQYLAPTGKAAHVLRSKGAAADTIHSFIYDFEGVTIRDDGSEQPEFSDKMELMFQPSLVVVDEASMVNGKLYDDLVNHPDLPAPILFVGDHGQLPPVGSDPGLMRNPQAKLETIHRQAEGNPIIAVSKHIREGGSTRELLGGDLIGDEVRIGKIKDNTRLLEYAKENGVDQILVPFNDMRRTINLRAREVEGRTAGLDVGEQIICLLNDRKKHTYNGMIFTVKEIVEETAKAYTCRLIDDTGRALPTTVDVWKEGLGSPVKMSRDERLEFNNRRGYNGYFDYCTAITTHKAQGSSWRHVMVMERVCTLWDHKRWMYTACTRAEEKLTIAL